METPTLMACTYGDAVANANIWPMVGTAGAVFGQPRNDGAELQKFQAMVRAQRGAAAVNTVTTTTEEAPMSERRLVRVVMVDPHEDVPTESALLYDSKEVFTDKTDQELYFDMPVSEILKAHNEKRSKIVDKSVKERTEYLEPARIRDLKMLVITLAKF